MPQRVPFIVAELGRDTDPFMLHLNAARLSLVDRQRDGHSRMSWGGFASAYSPHLRVPARSRLSMPPRALPVAANSWQGFFIDSQRRAGKQRADAAERTASMRLADRLAFERQRFVIMPLELEFSSSTYIKRPLSVMGYQNAKTTIRLLLIVSHSLHTEAKRLRVLTSHGYVRGKLTLARICDNLLSCSYCMAVNSKSRLTTAGLSPTSSHDFGANDADTTPAFWNYLG
jgi:hypothetical protein